MRVDRTARSGRSWSVKLRVGVRTLWAAAQGQRAARAASGSRSSFLPPPLTENRLWSPAGTWFVHPDFVTKFVNRDGICIPDCVHVLHLATLHLCPVLDL